MGVRLRSSSMHDLIRKSSFGPFYHHGCEFLRRVGVTVRDRDWREVSPTRWACRVKEAERVIEVTARHRSDRVDFEWQGRLTYATDECEVAFEFEGRALKTMEVCRVGLVVLHPVHFMTGAQVTTRGPNGEARLVVPAIISPQRLIDGVPTGMSVPFSSMRIEQPSMGRLDLDFSGDLFELEDQRNWGDASFKSYCTPLGAGFPRAISEGARIAHRLNARLIPARIRGVDDVVRTECAVGSPAMAGEIKIGRMVPASFETLEGAGWMLGWDHICIDWDESTIGRIDRVLARLPDRATLEIGLEVDTLLISGTEVLRWLHGNAKRVSTLILRDLGRPLPTTAAVAKVRAALRNGPAQRTALLAAPTGYFAELNRGQPFELDVDGVAFPVSSTVHGDDADTILDNSRTVADMIATARRITGRERIAISPLAHYFPGGPDSANFPSSINSPWLAAAVAAAAGAAAASITLATDVIEPASH
jgi:hypothetical protein